MAGKAKSKTAAPKSSTKSKPKTVSKAKAWVDKIGNDKKFKGKAQVKLASDLHSAYTLRRPCGILGLDIGLGGGFHAGGGIQVFGQESVGKTHLAYRVGAQVQKNYGDEAAILIYSTEIKPDKGFARQAGLCVGYTESEIEEYELIRKVQGLPPFTKEEKADLKKQVGDVVVSVAENADVGLATVLDALEMGAFQLIIIESLGALLPKAQEERDVGDMKVGGSANLLTDFQNKMYPYFMMEREDGTSTDTTIIGINQARAKIGYVGRGSNTKPAADAYAWKHGQLASIELSRGADIREAAQGPVIGKDIRWKLVKGKAGTHDGKRGEFKYYHIQRSEPVLWSDVENYWLGGVDVNSEAVETGKAVGLIEMAGAWLSWNEDGKQILRAQGTERFAEELIKDPELIAKFRDACIKKSNLLVRYR